MDNITMYLREMRWDDVGWIVLAQDRNKLIAVVKTAVNLHTAYRAGKLFSSIVTIGL
jgi:hypothetical protein